MYSFPISFNVYDVHYVCIILYVLCVCVCPDDNQVAKALVSLLLTVTSRHRGTIKTVRLFLSFFSLLLYIIYILYW